MTKGEHLSQAALDEERLLVERAQRSPEAFGDLYTRYHARVYAYAYNRTHDRDRAEDIASETFLLAFEHIGRYEWRNVPFSAWLFRIASSQIAMHYRKLNPCLPIDGLAIQDRGPDPETEVLRASDADEIQHAMAFLTDAQRQAVELRYSHDLRTREIASRMGRTEGSVRLMLHRASRALRSQMLPLSA